MEYESATQKVVLFIESVLQSGKQLQHARLSWYMRFQNYRPWKPLQFADFRTPCLFILGIHTLRHFCMKQNILISRLFIRGKSRDFVEQEAF
jgi:hypothetical protein